MTNQTAKLQWMCRRGMKELDVMLVAYLEYGYITADESEQAAFERLLQLQDPALYALLMGYSISDAEDMTLLLEKIRGAVAA